MRIRHLAAAALAAAAMALTACSVTTHPTADAGQVEQTVADRLQQLVGQRPDSVDCPRDLEGVPGATLQCRLTTGSEVYAVTVTVTVTSVHGTDIGFDFEVAQQPLP